MSGYHAWIPDFGQNTTKDYAIYAGYFRPIAGRAGYIPEKQTFENSIIVRNSLDVVRHVPIVSTESDDSGWLDSNLNKWEAY